MHTGMKEGRLKEMATVASSQMKHLDDLSVMCPGLQSATIHWALFSWQTQQYTN